MRTQPHDPARPAVPSSIFAALTPVLVAIGAACIALIGCTPRQHGKGWIYIDRPEVFTRERLLNRRLSEQSWLEQQLNKPADSNLQGLQDIRTFEGLYLKAEGQFDPLAPAGAAFSTETAQVKAETDLLRARKDLALARRELEDAQGAAPDSNGSGGASPPAAAGAGASTPAGQASAAAPSRSALFNGGGDPSFAPLPDPAGIATSRAELTSLERLRDQAAYRNAVQSLMREQELDDTHDLLGRTLYTLKFDVSVVAGVESDALAAVECSVTIPEDVLDDHGWQRLYHSWLDHLQERMRDEAFSLQRRVAAHSAGQQTLSDAEWLEVAALAARGADSRSLADAAANSGFTRMYADYAKDLQALVVSKANSAPRTDEALRSLRRAATLVVVSRYLPALSDYLDVNADAQVVSVVNGSSEEYYVPVAIATPVGHKAFRDKLRDESGRRVYVYTVEPKELAQNISEVEASEKLMNLVMSLKASLPQAGFSDLSTYAEYVRRSQHLLHGVLRKPLVVGFIKDQTSFGWILGPRFHVGEDATAAFGHTAVQNSIQATLVVPAWSPKVVISTSTHWICDDATPVPAATSASAVPGKPVTYEVDLPGDLAVITRRLLADARMGFSPKPVILDKDRVGRVSTGLTQLLIRGSDLWRNPEVYIDSQRADEVRVLPDMGGIVANFKDLRLPPGVSQSTNAEVKVVTSAGMDVGFVQIVPREQQDKKAQRFLTLESRYFVGNGRVVFTKDPQYVPAAYNNLRLRVTSPTDATDSFDVPLDPSRMTDGQRISWEIPAGASKGKAWFETRGRINVQAQIQLQPNGMWLDVSGGPASIVHFNTPDDYVATISAKPPLDPADDTNVLGISIAGLDYVNEAFPDFEKAWSARTVRLRFEHEAEKHTTDVVIDGDDRGGARFIRPDTLKAAVGEALGKLTNKKGDQTFKLSLVDERGKPAPVAIHKDSATIKIKGE